MPVTISHDITAADNNERNYIRSMFERFGWKRLGGSVFRYSVENDEEDWLNEVAPALMMFRSYVIARKIELRFFTLDTASVAHIDLTDPQSTLGYAPDTGDEIFLFDPTNKTSSEKRIRRGIDALIDLFASSQSD